MTKHNPATFAAPAVAFDATPTTPPASTGRMTPARRRALLGHTADGRVILAAEDARNGAREPQATDRATTTTPRR